MRSVHRFLAALAMLLIFAIPSGLAAPFTIDLTNVLQIKQTPIAQGASRRPDGATITVDGTSLMRDGKRWTPVMGEFHYSRYDPREWRDELLKMKAGGVDIVATYVFWIHHEEIEGKWDWSGQRSLRDFVALCGQLGLQVVVRCGPWAHGECRNGGFPDWIVDKGVRLRSDDPSFLREVRDLYDQIASQLKGQLWSDGGPVIGVQFDNEFGGAAAYLLALKKIAIELGMDVPLYTRTGWPRTPAGMPYGEILPMYGSYGDGFWDRSLNPMPGNFWQAYVFGPDRLDTATGGDRSTRRPNADDTAPGGYPFLTCELGGGMVPSYHRRIRIEPMDVAAVPLTKLGSGSNLLGYYMYHGGTHPEGQLSSMQEMQATKMTNSNDMPAKSYDFQAPIGEYGQVREHYNMLRRLHLFLHDFGPQLATMPAFFPATQAKDSHDTETLRWSARSDGTSGYIFVNNYQRLLPMPAKQQVQFELNLARGKMLIPSQPVTIPADSSFIWPFNLDLGDGAKLIYATAQVICQIDDGPTKYTIFAKTKGVPAEFALKSIDQTPVPNDGTTIIAGNGRITTDQPGTRAIRFRGADGKAHAFILLDDADSLGCFKAKLNGVERIFLTHSTLMLDGDSVRLRSTNPADLSVALLPAPQTLQMGNATITGTTEGVFSRFTAQLPQQTPLKASIEQSKTAGPPRQIPIGGQRVAVEPADSDFDQAAVWQIKLPEGIDPNRRLLLRAHYIGDVARFYLDGKFLTDNFYNGNAFDISVNRYGPDIYQKGLVLKILPIKKDAPIYFEKEARPDFGSQDSILKLEGIDVVEEREAAFKAN